MRTIHSQIIQNYYCFIIIFIIIKKKLRVWIIHFFNFFLILVIPKNLKKTLLHYIALFCIHISSLISIAIVNLLRLKSIGVQMSKVIRSNRNNWRTIYRVIPLPLYHWIDERIRLEPPRLLPLIMRFAVPSQLPLGLRSLLQYFLPSLLPFELKFFFPNCQRSHSDNLKENVALTRTLRRQSFLLPSFLEPFINPGTKHRCHC